MKGLCLHDSTQYHSSSYSRSSISAHNPSSVSYTVNVLCCVNCALTSLKEGILDSNRYCFYFTRAVDENEMKWWLFSPIWYFSSCVDHNTCVWRFCEKHDFSCNNTVQRLATAFAFFTWLYTELKTRHTLALLTSHIASKSIPWLQYQRSNTEWRWGS